MSRAPQKRRVRLALASVAARALALPAFAAAAAKVAVVETPGFESTAKLSFEADPAEANHLTVNSISSAGTGYELQLFDSAAALEAGSGCLGGGPPGNAVFCQIHKPQPAQYENCTKNGCTYVPGSHWVSTLRFTLGDGGSILDASALPQPVVEGDSATALGISVAGGAGDDTIITASGDDTVESSPGDDTVGTGAGNDVLLGGPAPDGADDVDLGPGRNAAEYRERKAAVEYHEDNLANDGALGEGDRILGAQVFWGGAGNDTIEGASPPAPRTPGDAFVGGAGNDLLIGGEGEDVLFGGIGDDRLDGRGGNDYINEPTFGEEAPASGNDFASGGPGDDEFRLSYGNDHAEGGPGADRIELGAGDDSGDGGADGDFLRGEEGDDLLAGGEGGDRLIGDRGVDTLEGGEGDDRIAAGAVVSEPWESLFVFSPGPIENEPDRVDCGPGSDKATIDKTDTAGGCEPARRVRLLETFGVFQAQGPLEAQLQYEVRRPGLVTLSSPGLRRRRQKDDARYSSFTHRLLLHPIGRAKRRLSRTGRVTIPLTVTFHWGGGHRSVQHRTVRLDGV